MRLPGQHNSRPSVAGRAHRQVRISSVRSTSGSQRSHPVRVLQALSSGRAFGVDVCQRYMESTSAANMRSETTPTRILPLSKRQTTPSGVGVSPPILLSHGLARITRTCFRGNSYRPIAVFTSRVLLMSFSFNARSKDATHKSIVCVCLVVKRHKIYAIYRISRD